jgi:hypothetical protein
MKEFIAKSMEVVKFYNIWDWSWFKLALLSAGILIGAYLAQFFMQYIWIVWVVFAITYIWIIYKTFFKYWKRK